MPPRFVIIGNPGSRALDLFAAALKRLDQPPARIVPYADLLAGEIHLAEVIQPGDIVRLESPGRDWPVERALLARGADLAAAEPRPYAHIAREQAAQLEFDKGRIWYPRQWYLGYCDLLREIGEQLDEAPNHHRMNDLAAIPVMFDKVQTHARLSELGLPVPPALKPVRKWNAYVGQMANPFVGRHFFKLAHGSSGAGIVAYQTRGGRERAFTTVEVVQKHDDLCLYNTRRIRRLDHWLSVANVIDALGQHRLHVETWRPKAGIEGHTFDLRVVVIDGQVQHTVARLSRNPITNLHLLNQRRPFEMVRARLSDDAWAAARRSCEAATAAFPGSFYVGVDLLIAPNFKDHAILEVNAFGDLLPGVLHQGRDTYTAEIEAMLARVDASEARRQHDPPIPPPVTPC